MPTEQPVIRLGMGMTLVHEDYFLNVLGPFGMTRKGFRAFCAALCVPMLQIGRQDNRFVDQTSFLVAMRHIMSVGQKNFAAPGSAFLADRRGEQFVCKVDVEELAKNHEVYLAELVAAYKLKGWQHLDVREEAVSAVSRVLSYAFSPTKAQRKFDKQALEFYRTEVKDDPPIVTAPSPNKALTDAEQSRGEAQPPSDSGEGDGADEAADHGEVLSNGDEGAGGVGDPR